MNIGDILNYNISNLVDYIINSNNRKEILTNNKIRKILLADNNHIFFNLLIKSIGDDIKYFCDDDFRNLLLKNKRCIDIINNICDCNSKYKNEILRREDIIKRIIFYISKSLDVKIRELDESFGKEFFKCITDDEHIFYLCFLNEKAQLEVLKNKDNLMAFKNCTLSNYLLCNLSNEAINYLLNDDYFLNRYISLKAINIDNLVQKGVILPIKKEIIDLYLSIFDINTYRFFVNNLLKNNLSLYNIIETKRKEKYDNELIKVNDESFISNVASKMEIKKNTKQYRDLKKYYNERFQMILIDRYFEDVPYNFMLNLEMMLNFIKSVNNKVNINEERLALYQKIYAFDKLTTEEQMSLYKEMNNGKNYSEDFYDDYRKCKDCCYEMYANKIINPDKMEKSPLSEKYQRDIYELDGEKFIALIHQTEIDRNASYVYNVWKENSENTISFSLISNNHLVTIYYDDCIKLGFSNVDKDNFMHIYHTDSFTDGVEGSCRINEILGPEDLIDRTEGYNELLYLESNTNLKPSYIMCYDKITAAELELSSEYNIPIVLLHTKKYKESNSMTINYDENNYIDLLDYENKGLPKRK